jgi:adenosylcobyric acid synthase
VFASLVGTVELVSDAERKRIRGFLINKFRGEVALLEPGLRLLEQRTGLPILGVLPYQTRIGIQQEDSASLDGRSSDARQAPVKIGVVHFPRISNYTDFQPLEDESDVAIHYLSDPLTAPALDVLILPGTKSTAADLKWVRSAGWENFLARHRRAGGWMLGICGGYQMLGQRISDPERVEGEQAETIGLGMLPIETIFQRDKITERVAGVHLLSGLAIEGYEIHAGRIKRATAANGVFRVFQRGGIATDSLEGAYSEDKCVIGTSIHGIFESPAFRRKFIDSVRESKGLAAIGGGPDKHWADHSVVFDRLADMFEHHVDMSRIAAFAGLTWKGHPGGGRSGVVSD